MYNLSSLKRYWYLIAILITVSLYILYYDEIQVYSIVKYAGQVNFVKINENSSLRSTYSCSCRGETIHLTRENEQISVHSKNSSQETKTLYKLSESQFEELKNTKCDIFNVLRRGYNQKVIGYSLYGTNKLYYESLELIVKQSLKYYPDWILRIHHNDSIDKNFICMLECLKNDNGNYIDKVDFCNVKEIPLGLSSSDSWDASYMHAMTWRWLPIGDPSVDYFMSRDTDSWFSQREFDSVNVWMNSNKLFHIMRDHPQHGTTILGGLWGYANERDRNLSQHIFKKISNEKIASEYNIGKKNPKGYDQYMLTNHVYELAKTNAIIHDSFTCKKFGGSPFPTRRENNFCFVGCRYCCNQNSTTQNFKCPIECRPKDHADWIYC